MHINGNSFQRDVMERLLDGRKMEVSLHKSMLYMKKFFPVEELHITYYDSELKIYKLLAVATNSGAKRTNFLMPLTQVDLAALLDPNAPDTELIDIDKKLPAMVHYDRKLAGHWFMMLRLRTDEIFGTAGILAKGPKPFSQKHVKLYSVLKPPFTSFLRLIIRNDNQTLLKQNMIYEGSSKKLLERYVYENGIIGAKSGLKQVLHTARQVALFDSPIMILGETGVGKEMVARLIHSLSPRRHNPYVPVNCGAIPDTLIDSELFGYDKGAFTGAISSKKGIFEQADTGTVFLDEVAELPLKAQVRMLRVLQEKTIQHVGGAKQVKLDIRIIAATHRNLYAMINHGKFRSDLWFRLHVVTITVPPLRERKEDIPLIIKHFLEKKSKQLKIPVPLPADGDDIAPLLAYDWPGNVRELENVVERALILSQGHPKDFYRIVRGDESFSFVQGEENKAAPLNLDHVVSTHIKKVLKLCKGKINGPGGAAEKLGIHPATLRNRMNKLGIPYGKMKNNPLSS